MERIYSNRKLREWEPVQRVVFRTWKSTGDVIALFPDQPENRGCIGSYMHVGQHAEADPCIVYGQTRPSKPREYKDLLIELANIGYRLVIRKRLGRCPRKLREAFHTAPRTA